MYRSDCRWTDFFGYFGTDRSKQPLCWLTVELELRLVWNSRLNCPTSLFHRCPGGHVDHSNSRALVLSWKPLRRTGDSLVSGSFCVPWTQHPDSEVMVSCWSCGASWSRAFIVAMTLMRWDTSFCLNWRDPLGSLLLVRDLNIYSLRPVRSILVFKSESLSDTCMIDHCILSLRLPSINVSQSRVCGF
jgi:hypothetical protein